MKWGNVGDASSTGRCYYDRLEPGDTMILTIGHREGLYRDWDSEGKCEGSCGWKTREEERIKFQSNPHNNQYYNYDKPEGQLTISYIEASHEYLYQNPDEAFKVKEMPIYLKAETEKCKELRISFEKHRKDQVRRAKWGETLFNTSYATYRSFKDEPDVLGYVAQIIEDNDKFVKGLTDKKNFWEKVLSSKVTPTDLEKYDGKSNEEIQKEKMEKRKAVLTGPPWKMNFKLLRKEMEENYEEKCTCDMLVKYKSPSDTCYEGGCQPAGWDDTVKPVKPKETDYPKVAQVPIIEKKKNVIPESKKKQKKKNPCCVIA